MKHILTKLEHESNMLLHRFNDKLMRANPGKHHLLSNVKEDCRKRQIIKKMQFSINDFFSKCDQICRKLWNWLHSLKKSLMENCNSCAVEIDSRVSFEPRNKSMPKKMNVYQLLHH